jgi:predicted RNA methylase
MIFTITETKQPPVVVAYFTKGLEDVVLGELHQLLPDAEVIGQPDERFAFARTSVTGVAELVRTARTIDDLRLLVAGPATVTSEADLVALCEQAADQTTDLLGDDRAESLPWSLTLSARNPSWRNEPRWQPDPVLARILRGADLTATERRPVDLRLQIDGSTAHLSLNVLPRPIGKADEAGVVSRPGALRPTVAAALVRLAVAQAPQRAGGLYDPFCGTGTIVAEAMRLNIPVFASDTDPEAIEITRSRLARLAGLDEGELVHRVFVHNVLHGIPGRVDVPLTVSNLPWGKQVRVDRRGDLFDLTAAIAVRGLDRGGACALLTTHEGQLAARLHRRAKTARIATRRISLLGQTPGIVTAVIPKLEPSLRRT